MANLTIVPDKTLACHLGNFDAIVNGETLCLPSDLVVTLSRRGVSDLYGLVRFITVSPTFLAEDLNWTLIQIQYAFARLKEMTGIDLSNIPPRNTAPGTSTVPYSR